MGQIERLLAALSVLLVFLYVVLRSIYVPTFHDEAATFFHYIVTEKYLPYQAHWDANNHILNSALGFLCYKILGPQQWWIRLPNVLSFLVFGFFAVRISTEFKNRFIRWMALIAILTAAFPLEFFSLARGYAMSIAFFLGAIYYAAKYFRSHQVKYQMWLWFWMWLAVAASLTLLNSYLILLGLVGLSILLKKQERLNHFLVFVGLGFSVFLVAALYAFELKERGLLYTGLADGFIEVTVRSLVRYQLDRESAPISIFVATLGAFSSLFLIVRFLARSLQWNAIRLSAVLLLFNAIASIMLNVVFGMNFPENRVGMYYIPLFLIVVAGALDEWSETNKKASWLALAFLVFPAHFIKHANFNSTILWPKWHASDKIYNKVVEMQREQGNTIMVSAEYLNELGWAYYNFQNNSEMQLLQREPVPDTLADLIIARPSDFDFTQIPYDTVFHDAANDVYLLGRKAPIKWGKAVEAPDTRKEFGGTDEFYELVNDSIAKISGTEGLWELSGVFTSKRGLFDGQLIITAEGEDWNKRTYNTIPLHWIKPNWNGDTLYIKRTFSFPKDAVGFKIYIWNINHDEISFKLNSLKFQSPE